jgi:hypothetical protein
LTVLVAVPELGLINQWHPPITRIYPTGLTGFAGYVFRPVHHERSFLSASSSMWNTKWNCASRKVSSSGNYPRLKDLRKKIKS